VARKPLGELIVERGLATADQVRRLLQRARREDAWLGTLAVNEGLIAESQLKKLLADQAGVEPLPDGFRFKPELAELLAPRLAKKYGVVPLKGDRRKLAVGTAEPENVPLLDELAFATGLEIVPYFMLEGEVADALDVVYADVPPVNLDDEFRPPERGPRSPRSEPSPPRPAPRPRGERPAVGGGENAAVNLVAAAVERGAHSVHLRLTESELSVRLRISGKLEPGPPQPYRYARPLLNQFKVLAGLPAAERHTPQSGHFRLTVEGRPVAVGCHFTPTLAGERAVLILEARRGAVPDFTELGLPDKMAEELERTLESRHGLILLTGPPFSRKKDLAYAMLERVDTRVRAALTVEEHTSYRLEGLDTIQPLPEEGLDYSAAVEAALEQEPDVLFTDELPAAGAIDRLIGSAYARSLVILRLASSGILSGLLALRELGREPFLFASSLLLATSQRQLRRLCPDCKRPYKPTKAVLESLRIAATRPFTFYEATGCPTCDHTGSTGTVIIYEHLKPTSQIRQLLSGELSLEELSRAARRAGLRTAREAALDLALSGEVSVAEILRLT
jgi:type IV pilus assembly protein PilB